ncbi:MAG: hypothetical protein Fur0018_11320 [Anaerolineales bacterium]
MPVLFAPLGLEFHVTRAARQRYNLDDALFGLRGNVLFANFKAVRDFTARINQHRPPEEALHASDLNSLGLIDEILHFVSAEYRRQRQPMALHGALSFLQQHFGEQALDTLLRSFIETFPAAPLYRAEMSLEAYLSATVDGLPAREAILEEIIMLALANENPAMQPIAELFDDRALRSHTVYAQAIEALYEYFESQPHFGPENQNLLDLLRTPARRAPHSLQEQLKFLLAYWRTLLGDRFYYRILGGLDFIEEETRIRIGTGGGGAGTPVSVPTFSQNLENEPERFSQDRNWMPSVVLIARHTYVWLDQLSRQYQRAITRLDQIPDQELETLARRGFTGLWLIGLWERSSASQKIKHLCGNPDAVASAYALYDYQIADDLGGYEAYQRLRERAARYGIRLAADMVPNHTGIYSRWVVEHPDWFISLPYSPYPNYTFNGPNLSEHPGVGIYLEDHYYTRTDAAVVFKRVDHHTGETRFIYHGNDGTSMPWNDTAQLNYLNPEVREAVIQTILHVARMFPVIRFDAAMTLAKKHYQRLWFPEPGSGGDIPSRAEFGLTRQDFDAAMPQEFWREVVERIAAEAPDTLLLAEAFWMMEGYFVRSLGMHRVYNSAFMNMLRDEKNAEYRAVIKNTLEFDPEILQRYVNFMNNPDERTATEQFGKGDKYFGICLLMSTLPGLPMFGHGQVEGFSEKYGMEYRRAYWSEQPDAGLVARHEAEIAPLLHRRRLFAEAENFTFYDFYTPQGSVDENVFAYSNRRTDERALVIYHNAYAHTAGWIHSSAAFAVKDANGEKHLAQRTLIEGLALHNDPKTYTIFRDHKSGLEYIRNNHELYQRGLYVELSAYQYHVFLDFRQVHDTDGRYARLHDALQGSGVPDIEAHLRLLALRPLHQAARELLNAGQFEWALAHRHAIKITGLPQVLAEIEAKTHHLADCLTSFTDQPVEDLPARVRTAAEAALRLATWDDLPALNDEIPLARRTIQGFLETDPARWGVLLAWVFTHPLGNLLPPAPSDTPDVQDWFDAWLLEHLITQLWQEMGLPASRAALNTQTWRVLLRWGDWRTRVARDGLSATLTAWLNDPLVHTLLKVNEYQGVLWFQKEAFDAALHWMLVVAAVQIFAEDNRPPETQAMDLQACYATIRLLQQAEIHSEYQIARLLAAIAALEA